MKLSKFIAISATVFIFATFCVSCNQSLKESQSTAVSPKDIKDGLSVSEYRDYGKTSPTTVSTRIGDLSFTKGGFAGG